MNHFSDLVKDELSQDALIVLRQFEDRGFCDHVFRNRSHTAIDSHKMVFIWCEKNFSGQLKEQLGEGGKTSSIANILDTIYYLTGCLDELYLFLLGCPSLYAVQLQIMGFGKSSRMTTEETLASLTDVFECASVNCQRYVDVISGRELPVVDFPLRKYLAAVACVANVRPVYLALLMSRPDCVRMLLSYGAEIPIIEEDHCLCWNSTLPDSVLVPRHPVMHLLRYCKEVHLMAKELMSGYGTISELPIVSALCLLLVDVPYHSHLARFVCSEAKEMTGVNINDSVVSLKNICRANIRRSVKEGGRGFHPLLFLSLPLPVVLKNYVSIAKGPVF